MGLEPGMSGVIRQIEEQIKQPPVLAFPDFKLPFILTTDASTVGLGAVLSQVQEGIERSVSFASRQLNKAERAYSASELETLVVVWATKYYRCYLHGKRFLVRTDHAALKFLHNFAENNSRLMRWSLRLSKFDFEIEHVPGSKIKHVDALSRHVGLVEETHLMSKEVMMKEQTRDFFSKELVQNCLTANSKYFLDMDGVLYRRVKSKQPKVVVPQSLIQEVIAENHNPIFVAHPGNKRTLELISLKYWWPKMRQSIEEYVRRDKCQTRKGKHEFRAPLGAVEDPSEPFQVTSMDITGPYSVTPKKNKYLLTFIDHFTKYVEAFPITDVSAETCARIYATQIIARHGSGSTLITDQGSSFTSAFFRETRKILKVRKVRTSAYHAMSNGMVERFHRVLHDSIAHYIDSTGTNWDVVLPFFLMAYRGTPHSTTGYSPFYLLHGREMVLPNEGDLKAKILEKYYLVLIRDALC
jgi:transposase InsO family protein